MQTPTEAGQLVKYIHPLEGDAQAYKVIEIDLSTDWCLIEAQVDMNIKPTQPANISDLQII